MELESSPTSEKTSAGTSIRDVADLGARVRKRRKIKNMSLRQLAYEIEVSPSLLSKFENGATNVSVAVLRKLADALAMSVPDLFDDQFDAPVSIAQPDWRRGVRYAEGFEITLLTRPHVAPVGIYLGRLEPGGATSAMPYSHGTEGDYEFVFVTSGSIVVQIDSSRVEVEAGESLDFFSTTKHRILNESTQTAEILWAIYPPK